MSVQNSEKWAFSGLDGVFAENPNPTETQTVTERLIP